MLLVQAGIRTGHLLQAPSAELHKCLSKKLRHSQVQVRQNRGGSGVSHSSVNSAYPGKRPWFRVSPNLFQRITQMSKMWTPHHGGLHPAQDSSCESFHSRTTTSAQRKRRSLHHLIETFRCAVPAGSVGKCILISLSSIPWVFQLTNTLNTFNQ